MSEVDISGTVQNSFTDVDYPQHLSSDNEGHILVVDASKDRVLLLNSQLRQQRILIDGNSLSELQAPTRLCYNELTSQLYILHQHQSTDCAVSLFSLCWSSLLVVRFVTEWEYEFAWMIFTVQYIAHFYTFWSDDTRDSTSMTSLCFFDDVVH